jgi:3-carboxy-cis,cis-muconate cycloisomerase
MITDGMNSFLFSTPEMTRVFSPTGQLRAMARFEWALSSALESNGRAKAGSGAVLQQLLEADFVDMGALVLEAKEAGNVAIPFVRQLTQAVMARSEAAARSVHLGATSQDVLDTALVLQMREALDLLEAALARMDEALSGQVRRHRDTVMQGRTWLQPGPPTTLGLKLAGVLAALRRDRERIRAEANRVLVMQFGGAVGTLACAASQSCRPRTALAYAARPSGSDGAGTGHSDWDIGEVRQGCCALDAGRGGRGF